MPRTCDYKEYEKPRGCRRRATWAIGYLRLFGHRATGKGDVAEYSQAVAFRCLNHADSHEWGDKFIAAMPVQEFESRLQAKTPNN